MHSQVECSYRFGPYCVVPAERLLQNGDQPLDLPPRAFDILLVLLRNSGHLVEKEKMIQAVWPDTAVEENNLSQAIYLLRKALHDGENGQRFIETVPRKGYRFVARVESVEPDSNHHAGVRNGSRAAAAESGGNGVPHPKSELLEPQAEVAQSPAVASKHFPWVLAATLTVLVAVSAGVAVYYGWLPRGGDGRETIRSIAVLPLENLSADPEQEYFADGMTDELITDLAQVRELKVVSKTSVMQYKRIHRPLSQIGRELGVDAVVEGSVLRSGDLIRITAQLIRTDTDRHLWAKAYEGELKNVLSLQSLVAQAITDEVKLNVTPEERNRLASSREVNPQAYEDYLRGRYAWNRRTYDGFQRGVSFFQQAIDKDPNFALAYAGLADCYILLALESPSRNLLKQAKVAAEKALALDDGLAEAHTSLAAVKIFLQWDWTGAENEFKRAINLNPSYAAAHHWYGNLLLSPLGRHQEALAELQRAQGLDPLSLIINTDLGYTYFLARDYDASFAQYQKVLSMDGTFVPVHHDLGEYYAARAMYPQWLNEEVLNGDLAGQQQRAEAFQSLYAEAGFRKVMAVMAESRGTLNLAGNPARQGSFCTAAAAYAALGQTQPALDSLQQCYEAGEPALIYLKVEPMWDDLRSQPKFQKIERSIGLN